MQSSALTVPGPAAAAVLQPSEPVPADAVSVQGPNFDESYDLQRFLESYRRIGFQAQSFGQAIDVVNRMVKLQLSFLANLLHLN